jgi:hypothetical protein
MTLAGRLWTAILAVLIAPLIFDRADAARYPVPERAPALRPVRTDLSAELSPVLDLVKRQDLAVATLAVQPDPFEPGVSLVVEGETGAALRLLDSLSDLPANVRVEAVRMQPAGLASRLELTLRVLVGTGA